jgi:predicted PurR-regulated permease PerM
MLLDPRGPRFAAALTSVVLVFVLIFASGWLALAQALVFGVSAVAPRYSPYGLVYRALLAPRLARPTELEPAAPVRFAQAVGLVFTAVAALGYLLGATALGLVMTAFALLAAFLNAAFGLCLGCEVYLAFRRLTNRPITPRVPAPGA